MRNILSQMNAIIKENIIGILLTSYIVGYIIISERRINMTRTFIEVPLFSKRWNELGLNEEDLLYLQLMLLENPKAGPVIEGTGGIRKARFALEAQGKSGSIRVCYTDFEEYETIYLITAYKKKEQSNLTNEEKKTLRNLIKNLLECERNRRENI